MTDQCNSVLAPQMEPRRRQGRKLSIVVPMFNESAVIDIFFARMRSVLETIDMTYELICVDDGSGDDTLLRLIVHHQRDPRIKIIHLSRNFGKEAALTAGLDIADGDAVVPIDADLQDPPELIEALLQRWEEGYDVVYGERRSRTADSAVKRVTARAFYNVFNGMANVPIPANAGDFRLIDQAVVEALRMLPERNRFMKGLFAWVGYRSIGVPYDRPERAAGTSTWRYWRLWNFALDGITSFTSVPLRIWTYVGLAVSVVAMMAAALVVGVTLVNGRAVPGYASLMVVVLVNMTLNLLAFGVLGEYVGRIYDENKRRPLYLVASSYGVPPMSPPRAN